MDAGAHGQSCDILTLTSRLSFNNPLKQLNMSKKRKGRKFRPAVISLSCIPLKPVDPERERQLEEFRQMFREAYPDAAKFIETIHVIPRKPEFYLDNGGIACDGFVSARGASGDNFSTGYNSVKGKQH